mmetsp:Transcript_105604/g.298683  ORF Transcript_105604/g.298683 Transcript_105604/m.298683 type:complete len:206 (+) Transcript_105604:83-700(+)
MARWRPAVPLPRPRACSGASRRRLMRDAWRMHAQNDTGVLRRQGCLSPAQSSSLCRYTRIPKQRGKRKFESDILVLGSRYPLGSACTPPSARQARKWWRYRHATQGPPTAAMTTYPQYPSASVAPVHTICSRKNPRTAVDRLRKGQRRVMGPTPVPSHTTKDAKTILMMSGSRMSAAAAWPSRTRRARECWPIFRSPTTLPILYQ